MPTLPATLPATPPRNLRGRGRTGGGVDEKGYLVAPAFAGQFAATLTDCLVVRFGTGKPYLQKDHRDAMGCGVADPVRDTEARLTGTGVR